MGLLSTLGKVAGTVVGGIIGGPTGAAVGSSLGGALGGDKEKRDAEKRSRQNAQFAGKAELDLKARYEKGYYQRLQWAARKGGFNPLAVLGAGGGAGYGSGSFNVPAVASTAALTGAYDTIDRWATGDLARDQQTASQQAELAERERERTDAGGAGTVVRNTVLAAAEDGEDTWDGEPGLWTQGTTRLIGMRGEIVEVPTVWARRLRVADGDAFIAEDFEALFGEQVGQVVALPYTAEGVTSLFKNEVQDENGRSATPRDILGTLINPARNAITDITNLRTYVPPVGPSPNSSARRTSRNRQKESAE